jgi:hypothetical protein
MRKEEIFSDTIMITNRFHLSYGIRSIRREWAVTAFAITASTCHMESIRKEWAVTAFAIQFCGTILHKRYPISKRLFPSSLIEFSIKSPCLHPLVHPLLVWPVPLAQVLPRPQLLSPSKTWFFGIYLNFQ